MAKSFIKIFFIFLFFHPHFAFCGRHTHLRPDKETDPLLGSTSFSSALPIPPQGEESTDSPFAHPSSLPDLRSQLMEWLSRDIFSSPPPNGKCSSIAIRVFGYCSALSRGALYFKLGYDLAGRVVNVGPAGDAVLSSLYGLGVAAPMAVLGLETSGDFVKTLLKKKSPTEKAIEVPLGYYAEKGIKYLIKPALIVISVISASTITYLTFHEFHEAIGWAWLIPGIPNFYTKTIIDYFAIPTVLRIASEEVRRPVDRHIGNKSPGGRKSNKTFIKDRLEKASDFIASLADSQAQGFLTRFQEDENILSKFSMLTKPHLFEDVPNVKKRNTWWEKIAAVTGGVIGVYGVWMYYPITKSAFKALLAPICDNETCNQLAEGLTFLALMSASPIMLLSAASSAAKFLTSISWLASKCKSTHAELQSPISAGSTGKKRAGAAVISTLLATLNASQSVQVSLDFLDMKQPSSQLAFSAAFLSFFSLSFWTVDEKFLKYLGSSNPRTPLLEKLSLIQKKINEMSDEDLISLSTFLRAN